MQSAAENAIGPVARYLFEHDEVIDGSVRRFDAELLPDIAEDGQVRGVYVSSIDITARSAAERALRELTEINDNTTDFVVQTDWRGDITYLNPAARVAMGIATDQPLEGLNFASFNTAQTNRHFAEIIVPLVKAKGVWIGESSCYLAGRREMPVSQIVIAHRGADGRLVRYSAVMRDITEQRRDQMRFARQAATLRSVTEAIPASIAVIGGDLCYRFVNKAFERWVGASREDLIGRSLAEVLGPRDYERSRPWALRALAGESVQFERDYDQPGRASHIAVSYIPLWMDDGSVDGFAILLSGVREGANAQRVANKVVDAARAPFVVDGTIVIVGASVGVAFGVQQHSGWPDLVARADALLYEAKNAGRGRQAGAD